jgi:hypothetical protein
MLQKTLFVLNGTVDWAGGWSVIAAVLFLYFFPVVIATFRRHRQTMAIFVLTLLSGWTGLGWVAAMVWASART